jgi:putative membrane protein
LARNSQIEFFIILLEDSAKDHREDIAEFEKEANSGQDQALKNFASMSLPTLRTHLEMAEKR